MMHILNLNNKKLYCNEIFQFCNLLGFVNKGEELNKHQKERPKIRGRK